MSYGEFQAVSTKKHADAVTYDVKVDDEVDDEVDGVDDEVQIGMYFY